MSCGNDVGAAGVSSRICTVTNKSRSWTSTVASSFFCTSPLAAITVEGFLDTRTVSSSAEPDLSRSACAVKPWNQDSLEVDFESSRLQARSESRNNPNRQCCAVNTHMAILSAITRVLNVRYQASLAFVTGSCPFCDCSCQFVYVPKNVSSTKSCHFSAFQDDLKACF